MKLFLLIGQSNMAGRGEFGEVPDIADKRCRILHRLLQNRGHAVTGIKGGYGQRGQMNQPDDVFPAVRKVNHCYAS